MEFPFQNKTNKFFAVASRSEDRIGAILRWIIAAKKGKFTELFIETVVPLEILVVECTLKKKCLKEIVDAALWIALCFGVPRM